MAAVEVARSEAVAAVLLEAEGKAVATEGVVKGVVKEAKVVRGALGKEVEVMAPEALGRVGG